MQVKLEKFTAMTIRTGMQKPALREVALRTAFALVSLGLAGSMLIGASQAQDGAARIISTPVATNFAKGVAKALNGVSFEITELNSVPALELMCAAKNAASPVLVLSAMTITPAIADQCVANGISALTEAQLGFLTLVLVQKSSDPPFVLTPRDLYRALASDVPADDGFAINTTRNWADVNPKLPALPIKMILSPRPGVTRSIFEADALVAGCRKYDAIGNIYEAAPRIAKCTNMRGDAIEEVDDAAARVEALRNTEPGAVALFPVNIYEENKDWLRVIPFDGFMPTPEDVNREDYTLSVPIYVYTHPELVTGGAVNADVRAWLSEALSENAIGDDGYLKTIGLTVLPKVTREWQRKAFAE
jgi:phosphate transport system substrate-binding protein